MTTHDSSLDSGSLLCRAVATAILMSAGSLAADERSDHTADDPKIVVFLSQYCYDCHGREAPEGGLNLQMIAADLDSESTQATWIRIHDRVTNGEMPPSDSEQPSPEEVVSFQQHLGAALTAAHAAEKGTVLRRLNRREFENTMNDLFGTNLKLASTLPEDGRSHEFDNVGSALSISSVQMRRYLESIEIVMDSAIATRTSAPEVRTVRASYVDTRGGEKFLGKQWLLLDDGAVVFFRRSSYPTGMLREANVQQAGLYRIRVTGYAHQSDKPITYSIGSTTFARGAEKPTFAYRSMPPGKPTTVELTTWIEDRHMVQIEPCGLFDRNRIKNEGIENYSGPGLAILHVEVEGPLTERFPSRGHDLLFSGLDRREIEPPRASDKLKPWYRPKFEIGIDTTRPNIQPVLLRIARAAFRRPITTQNIAPFVDLYVSEYSAGIPAEESLRTATTAIFCSPEFLFLQEDENRLSTWPLASRLSYFLNRTFPDQPLQDAAASGDLLQPEILRKETDRLIAHRHFGRFIDDFTDAWLNLRDINFTTPDRVLFPEFDAYLQHSSILETRAFIRELIERDLPIQNLIVSDFAMLNERLAAHYEIPDVRGPEIRKVELPPDSVRGGLLSQASVLKVSSNGTNTSPVVRGVYVLERLLGKTPPPPPPGISGVEPDIRGATTLRELLDRHRNDDSCRNCHQMIDPPGFALECFNPVGGYRDRFRRPRSGDRVSLEVAGRKVRYLLGPNVDASGQLQSGQVFEGFQDFRSHLASDTDRLARSFAVKLLTFATGREMGFSDRRTIENMVRQSAQSGHRIRNLVHLVIQSSIFRSR